MNALRISRDGLRLTIGTARDATVRSDGSIHVTAYDTVVVDVCAAAEPPVAAARLGYGLARLGDDLWFRDGASWFRMTRNDPGMTRRLGVTASMWPA